MCITVNSDADKDTDNPLPYRQGSGITGDDYQVEALSIDGMTKRSRLPGTHLLFIPAACLLKDATILSLKIFSSSNIYVIGTACLCMRYQIAHVHEGRELPVKSRLHIGSTMHLIFLLQTGPLVVV